MRPMYVMSREAMMGTRQPDPRADEPVNPNAARDHLANERTLLAWVRTSIAIMALGFVVARFGLLIRELGPHAPQHLSGRTSSIFGTALVVCGAVLVILATQRYLGAGRAIDRNTYRSSPVLVLVLSAGLVVVAALLVTYLLLTA